MVDTLYLTSKDTLPGLRRKAPNSLKLQGNHPTQCDSHLHNHLVHNPMVR